MVLAVYLPWRLAAAQPYDSQLFNRIQFVALVIAVIGGVAWYVLLANEALSYAFPRLWSYDWSIFLYIILYVLAVSSLALAAGFVFRPDHDPSRFNIVRLLKNRSITSNLPSSFRLMPIFLQAIFYAVLLYSFIFGINLYVSNIYPRLPQEMGGARPVCADLAIDAKRAQKPLLQRLGISQPSAGSDTSAPPLRVQLLYNGDKELIFTTGAAETYTRSFEIPQDIVLGIIGCEE
jgi:hypothetical protein